MKAVPYYRVSTDRQGLSGLGLDAQRATVEQFAKAGGITLSGEFIEIESSRKKHRPILEQALNACKREKAVLLIAKLDRLSRNVVFISTLLESDVEFLAVDNPYATKLLLHITAAFAEHERDQISQRTKQALQAAKRRGILLGEYGRQILSKRNKNKANVFANDMKPVFERLQLSGYVTIRSITKELNRQKIKTFVGGTARWHIHTVHAIIKRIEKLDSENQHSNY